MLQFLDSEGAIVGNLGNWLKKNDSRGIDSSFNVIAILGTQGSGKSTMLNHWFKTEFQVMDPQMGHSRTTKGIWMSKSNIEGTPTIVIDVEGTDSKDGHQDDLSFEHRTALFSLVIADCLIINVPYQSLGNYVGSSYSILKTVMQAHLELVQQDSSFDKTVLLFTIRDWASNSPTITPMNIIEEQIKKNYLEKIWSTIHKPSDFKNMCVDDIFEIKCIGLAHPLFQPEVFDENICDLNNYWNKQLKPKKYSKGIPLDNWPSYCINIWNDIINKKELDIPSVSVMIAITKCREIMDVILLKATQDIDVHTHNTSPMNDFVEWAENIIITNINQFKVETTKYNHNHILQIEIDFIANLLNKIQAIADIQFDFIADELSFEYSKKIKELFKSFDLENTANTDFTDEQCEELVSICSKFSAYKEHEINSILSKFNKIVQLHTISFFDEKQIFVSTKSSQKLQSIMTKFMDEIHLQLNSTLTHIIKQKINEELTPIKEFIYSKDSKSEMFWEKANSLIDNTAQNLKFFQPAWEGLIAAHPGSSKYDNFFSLCKYHSIIQLSNILYEVCQQLEFLASEKFQANFQPSSKGKQSWNDFNEDEISEFFMDTQIKSNSWITVFDKIEISYEDTQISEKEKDQIISKIKNHPDIHATVAKCNHRNQHALSNVYARRASSRNQWSQIPFMFWIILLILGFNEIVTIIKLIFSPYFIAFAALLFVLAIYSKEAGILDFNRTNTIITLLFGLITTLFKMVNKQVTKLLA